MNPGGRIGPGPRELLSAADDLLASDRLEAAGVWPRAVAILTRQAIEGAMFDLWRAVSPGVEQVSERAQLLILRANVPPAVATRAEYAWTQLSRACHHHPYELVPTASELSDWLDAAVELEGAVRKRLARQGLPVG